MEKEYSVTEIAEKRGVPYHKVIRMIKKGCFPHARKCGWGWIIPERDVLKVKKWKDTIREMMKGKK